MKAANEQFLLELVLVRNSSVKLEEQFLLLKDGEKHSYRICLEHQVEASKPDTELRKSKRSKSPQNSNKQ